jgi:hypothetical protein
MTRRCHLPFGTFPAGLAAGISLFDVLARTWDIAIATGVTVQCSDDLWDAGLDAARMVIGSSRDVRHYAAQVPVSAAAAPRQRFLALSLPGRARTALTPRRSHASSPSPSWKVPVSRPGRWSRGAG